MKKNKPNTKMKNTLLLIISLTVSLCFVKTSFGQVVQDNSMTVIADSLPINLLSFTGIRDKENIILKWSTASEINNGYYLIERSKDAINWEIVCAVRIAENSTTIKNYSITDKVSFNETAYYQIKQTDFNKKFDYYNIIEVKNTVAVLAE